MSDLERLYSAYGETLSDAVEMEYKRKIALERLRRDLLSVSLEKMEIDIFSLCEHVLELLDVRFERIAVVESLYRRMLHLFTSVGVSFRKEFVFPAAIGNFPERARAGVRSAFIWSRFFNARENLLLIEWMRSKSVTCAVLSLSKQIRIDKLKHFLRLAGENGISVELMGSDNEWVRPENSPSLLSFLARASSLTDTVHLDVEPHTFSDFDVNRQGYLEQYVRMIKTARRFLNEPGKKLTASVPFWLDREVLEQIAPDLDRIYVMAYGTNHADLIARRLKPFLSAGPKKVVAAVRPADFNDELEIEALFELLMGSCRITQFAFHDLSALIQVVGK